jgi:hypothetical protein
MLPSEITEIRKRLLTFPYQSLGRTLKQFWKFMTCYIYGDIHYISDSFCKNVLKNLNILA